LPRDDGSRRLVQVKLGVDGGKAYVSPSTDKQPKQLRVQFRVARGDQESLVHKFIGSGKPVEISSDAKRRWRIRNHSTSYSESSPFITFTWELLEIEDLKVEKLVINDLELVPYRYKEELDEKDMLTIDTFVELSEAEEKRLRALPTYFRVVRKGVQDDAREMRFGQILWSKKENEDKLRLRLTLVDKALDACGDRHDFLEPQFGNVSVTATVTRLRLRALLDRLVAKGVLSSEEVDAIHAVDEGAVNRELQHLFRVDDLDQWTSGE
jgi:hypothetical protein